MLAAERLSQDKAALARRLIQMRARLNVLLGIQRAGTALPAPQVNEAMGLVRDIKSTKAHLIRQGIPEELLINSAKLRALLKRVNKKEPALNFRSGGVGSFAQGSSVKFWR